jgi:hypothetical protein
MATQNIGRRPRSSDPGPQIIGPTTYPIKKSVVIKYEISADTPNSFAMWVDADVGAEDANVLQNVLARYACNISRSNIHVNGHHATDHGNKPFIRLGPIMGICWIVWSVPSYHIDLGLLLIFVVWRFVRIIASVTFKSFLFTCNFSF